jgi:3-oxoadipate enol-lactonase
MDRTAATALGSIAYSDFGSADDLPLLLLHGFPHDRAIWRAQREAQLGALNGVRLLLPDLPGFGQSPPIDGPPDLDRYADAVIAVLNDAGLERAVVGGLSMGGYIAFAAWRRHPHRIAGLVLCDTRMDADTDAIRAKRLETIARAETEGAAAVAVAQAPGQLGKTTRETNPELIAEVDRILRRSPVKGIVDAAKAMAVRPDSATTLNSVTVPTLIIVGDEDVVTPPELALAMQALVDGSRLVRVPDAGHLAPLENPTVVNAALMEFFETSGLI